MSLDFRVVKKPKGFTLEMDFHSDPVRLGVLGPWGCGKSMMLKCIAGIVRPDESSIKLNGRTLFGSAQRIDVPHQRRKVGYLFQNYALFPHLTVADNIACGLGLSKQEARTDKRVR